METGVEVVKDHGYCPSRFGITHQGINEADEVQWNLPVAELYEHAIRSGEGHLAENGALVCTTGHHTGRSPTDKFIVEDPQTRANVWWGHVNQPLSEAHFDRLHRRVIDHYRGRRLYVRDMFACAHPTTQIPIRVVTETAWHNLFAAQLFIRPKPGSTGEHRPQFTILNAPTCLADPPSDGTRSSTFVVIHFTRRIVLIGGTAYAGEIKKSVFTIMNYLLPTAGVLSMHCSANVGGGGDVALFFGLSGTGKTTLSADPARRLIGDDEHGWGQDGVFNIEGGCYAKCIKLSMGYEPQIYQAIRFGTVLENVMVDEDTREIDFDSARITENTRAAYPLDYIERAVIPSVAGHPRHILFLTCDAFGVLPPVARLNTDQALEHFLAGYTAKIAGTERGVTEPKATFSACFGAPFLPLPPERYATMLRELMDRHRTQCWLVNTGWTGGGVGEGKRINLHYTRAIVRAALSGALEKSAYSTDPVFGLNVPDACPDVPSEVLRPRTTWKDPTKYDAKARELAAKFADHVHSHRHAESGAAG